MTFLSSFSDSVPVVLEDDVPASARRPAALRLRQRAPSWPVLARVGAIGMTLLFSLAVGRELGTGAAGAVFTGVVLMTLLSTAGRVGVDLDAIKRAARLHDTGALTRESLGWSRLVSLCVLGSVSLTVLFVVVVGLSGDRIDQGEVYGVFALAAPLQALSVLGAAVLRGGGRSGVGLLFEVGLAQGLAALAVGVLGATGGVTATGIGMIFVLAQAVVCALSLWMVRSVWSDSPRPDLDDVPAAASRSELTSMMTSSLLIYALTWSPLLVLAALGSPRDASLYGAAARFPTAVAIIPAVLVAVVLPGLIASFAHDRVGEGNRRLARINRLSAAGAGLVSLPLVAAAPWMMGLFGPGFEDGAGVLRLLALGQLLAVLLGPTTALPTVMGFEKQAQWLLLASCTLSLASGAALVGRFGAEGAALAWAVSYTAYGVAMAWLLHRSMGVVTPVRLR